MPSKRKDTTTKQSMKNSYKRNLKSAFYEKFLQEEQKRIEQVDAHILKLVESTCYESYQKNDNDDKKARNYDEFCDLMMDVLARKKRKYEMERVPSLIKSLPPEIVAYSIVPFMDLESVLNGSVFLVCRSWYEGMIDEERMWQELFCRLWDMTLESLKSWTRWPTQYDSNVTYVKINRSTSFTTKPTVFKKSGKKLVKKHSYQFMKEFCLLKHSSFNKHSRIGPVRAFFLTTHQDSSYADTTLIAPSLYSRFHITSVDRKLTYVSVTDDGETDNTISSIHFTLDYYTALIPFSMRIDIDYSVSYGGETHEKGISISVSRLHSDQASDLKNPTNQTKLVLKQSDGNEGDKEEENDEESEQDETDGNAQKGSSNRAISTFKKKWIGKDFVKIHDDGQSWLFKFISTLGIDLLDEALYRMTDE
ncbi:predicted protein [Naegleria gruberi]|uniref:Predicted protein n=1 Tax=Naegleria gruberi TaxID=5762 RepID=D2VYQ7_NAEGR|nr:uncharacterized protein NAEGRDRAFT_74206 [Naegleria gruberi]EFC37997.1 predicted protein [Naegleria gruberi]|eukprot:XP_002670741.1 predicted protein [Naegleria gruberi strain NEG-M]